MSNTILSLKIDETYVYLPKTLPFEIIQRYFKSDPKHCVGYFYRRRIYLMKNKDSLGRMENVNHRDSHITKKHFAGPT